MKRQTVSIEQDEYKKAMIKAADQGIFTFSELVRQLILHYTRDEAKLRTSEKE